MDESILRELERFLEEGSPESFLRLRAAVAASKGYAPYGQTPAAAGSFAAREEWAQAKKSLLALMPTYFLNPQVHTLLSFVNHKLGDEVTARAEFALATRFMSGILSTGTGDRDHPYLVLNTEDEYDILERLSKTSRRQLLIPGTGRVCDMHECEDGSEVWFDVTTPYSFLARTLASKSLSVKEAPYHH